MRLDYKLAVIKSGRFQYEIAAAGGRLRGAVLPLHPGARALDAGGGAAAPVDSRLNRSGGRG